MTSNNTLAIVYNAFASLFGWTAFGLGIAAVISNNWRKTDGGFFTICQGLWNQCNSTGECVRIDSEPYLNATRAFMILFVIFVFLAGLGNIASQRQLNTKRRERSAGLYSIAGTFAVIGAAVYASLGPSGENGVGYAFAWTVVGLSYLAGIFQNLSAHKMDETK